MIIFAETDEVWTFNDINRQSNQLANYFLSIGYQKGDAIAVFMENHPKFMVVILALAKIGAVASLINNHLTQEVNLVFLVKKLCSTKVIKTEVVKKIFQPFLHTFLPNWWIFILVSGFFFLLK